LFNPAIFSSPGQRPHELLPLLGNHHLSTFHIWIFSSGTSRPNESKLNKNSSKQNDRLMMQAVHRASSCWIACTKPGECSLFSPAYVKPGEYAVICMWFRGIDFVSVSMIIWFWNVLTMRYCLVFFNIFWTVLLICCVYKWYLYKQDLKKKYIHSAFLGRAKRKNMKKGKGGDADEDED
jgi:hypothetical protein